MEVLKVLVRPWLQSSFFSGNVTGGVGMLRGLCAQEYPLALLRPTTTMVTLVGQPRAQGRRST